MNYLNSPGILDSEKTIIIRFLDSKWIPFTSQVYMRKPVFGVSDTNQTVQLQKMRLGWKFLI